MSARRTARKIGKADEESRPVCYVESCFLEIATQGRWPDHRWDVVFFLCRLVGQERQSTHCGTCRDINAALSSPG